MKVQIASGLRLDYGRGRTWPGRQSFRTVAEREAEAPVLARVVHDHLDLAFGELRRLRHVEHAQRSRPGDVRAEAVERHPRLPAVGRAMLASGICGTNVSRP